MYRDFEIKKFRGFNHLEMNDLERINLITGFNNVGKTTFLEALFLHCGQHNPSLVFNIYNFRGVGEMKWDLGQKIETPWASLFYEFSKDEAIELKGKMDNNQYAVLTFKNLYKQEDFSNILNLLKIKPDESSEELFNTNFLNEVLELEYTEGNQKEKNYLVFDSKGFRLTARPVNPSFPAYFLSVRKPISFKEDAELYGRLDVNQKAGMLVDVLKIIEPRLESLSMVFVGKQPVLHGKIDIDRLMPISILGEGIVRLTNIMLRIANAENGVVLIDEIESGFHYSILPRVWKVINETAKLFNTQIFATTHSLECITAAHNYFLSTRYEFKLFRIDRLNNKEEVKAYSSEVLNAALEAGLEIR